MVNIAEIKRQTFLERLEKAFGSEEIEKARHGVYADNAENRAKQRVGQEYGQAAQPQEPGEKRQSKGSEEGGGDIKSYASNASDEALKRAAADKNAKPEVREAAKNELANRNGGVDKKSEPAKGEEKKDADSAQPKDSEKARGLSKRSVERRVSAETKLREWKKKQGIDERYTPETDTNPKRREQYYIKVMGLSKAEAAARSAKVTKQQDSSRNARLERIRRLTR